MYEFIYIYFAIIFVVIRTKLRRQIASHYSNLKNALFFLKFMKIKIDLTLTMYDNDLLKFIDTKDLNNGTQIV